MIKFKEMLVDFPWLGKLIFIGITIVVAKILISMLNKLFSDKIVNRFPETTNKAKAKTIMNLTRNLMRIVIYFIAATMILDKVGVNTSSIIAAAGVGGIAIAFAAQSLVKDVINGTFILLENQFDIGDLVTISGSTGNVSDINLRTTTLKEFTGSVHIIPNGVIDKVINHSKNPMRSEVKFTVSTAFAYEELESILSSIYDQAMKDKDYFVEKPTTIGIDNMTDFSYTVTIAGYTIPGQQVDGQRYLRNKVLAVLQDNKIRTNILGEEDEKVSGK